MDITNKEDLFKLLEEFNQKIEGLQTSYDTLSKPQEPEKTEEPQKEEEEVLSEDEIDELDKFLQG